VAAQVDGLRLACGDPALKRVPPHITLVPPVNVRQADLDGALAVVRDAAAAADGPLELSLGPVSSFLPDNPVLILGVGGPGMAAVHVLREHLLDGPLAREITWPFVAHVTLADGADPDLIRAAEMALAGFEVTVDIGAVHVLEQGPDRVWTAIADAPLGPPSTVGRGSFSVEMVATGRPDPSTAAAMDLAPWCITARRHGRAVGAAVGYITGRTATLTWLAVDEDVRRMGIGRHLLAAVGQHALTQGCDELVAHLIAPDAALAATFEGSGWLRSVGSDLSYRRRV